MTNIHRLDQKKQADRRTALLGLVADQPASAGVCPTSAEMAELIDLCTIEKKEQFFRHIAVCETCYREWLTLQEVLNKRIKSKERSKIVMFFKPGNMTLFGTLLAAAASVVVFLNIYHPMNTQLTVPVESIRQEPAAPVQDQEKSRAIVPVARQDLPPAPENSVLKQKILRKKREIPASADAVKAEKKRSSPAAPKAIPPTPVSTLKAPVPAEQTLESAVDGAGRSQTGGGVPTLRQNRLLAGPAALGQWRQQLENGCREGRKSEAFWQEMEQRGREVKTLSEELRQDERKTLEDLLLLTTGMETANVPERCRRILDLLAQERKGRADGLP